MRLYVKTALLYFVAAVLIGALLMVDSLRIRWPWLLLLQPVYYHLITVGWLTQLIFGVAWWMFPTLTRERPRGPEWAAWMIWGLLNAGLLLRAVAEPMKAWTGGAAWIGLLHFSSLLQMLSAWAFTILMWPRVRDSRRRTGTKGA